MSHLLCISREEELVMYAVSHDSSIGETNSAAGVDLVSVLHKVVAFLAARIFYWLCTDIFKNATSLHMMASHLYMLRLELPFPSMANMPTQTCHTSSLAVIHLHDTLHPTNKLCLFRLEWLSPSMVDTPTQACLIASPAVNNLHVIRLESLSSRLSHFFFCCSSICLCLPGWS